MPRRTSGGERSVNEWWGAQREHWQEFRTYHSYWLSALYVVVEGDRKLGLDKSKVPEIKSPNVKKLELFRHGCFHFHPDAKKQLQFFKEGSDLGAMNWAELLHEQF